MPEAVDLGFALGLPPRDAISYFEARGYAISWDWWDVWQEANAKAFTAAKVTRLDILQSIRAGLQATLREGQTGRQFAAELEPYLKSQGWWGKVIAVAPDGGAEVAQLGSPWRLNTIYRTNMQTAYNAGRHAQQVAMQSERPHWQYLAVMDARTRPSHAALHRKVFAADDPIWQHVYPPNGFNCRCRVRALSDREIERRGLIVESSAGQLSEQLVEVGVDKRTGEVIQRPVTVWRGRDHRGRPATFRPDPGWDYNPGREWAQWDAVGHLPDCVSTSDFAAAGRCLMIGTGQPTWRDHGRPDARQVPDRWRHPAPEVLPAAASVDAAVEQIAAAVGITGAQRIITTPIEELAARPELLRHMVAKRTEARERYARYVLPTLEDPFEAWLTAYAGQGYRRRYIGLFTGGRGLAVIVRINADGSLMWNILPARDKRINDLRVGALLYAKPGR